MDLSHDAGTNSGEPQVAVDPADSRRRVVAWSAQGGSTGCGVARTVDAGAHWRNALLSPCTDAMLAWGPQGILYLGGVDFSQGGVTVRRSADGGATWSTPVLALGGQTSTKPASDLRPPTVAFDRPWLGVDLSSGALYVSGLGHDQVAVAPTTADQHFFGGGERFVTMSSDHGRTFGQQYAFGSAALPNHSMGTISASRGVLAAAYTTSAASAVVASGVEQPCPCTVFETSRDAGRTWARHVVPRSSPYAEAQDVVSAYVAADPARAGRFALGVIEDKGTRLVVRVTGDAGVHWRSRYVEPAGRYISNRPWLAYGTDGALGVMWRRDYHYDDACQQQETQLWFQHCAYDVYAAVSPHGDEHLSAPVRLSLKTTRASSSYAAGDDVSHAAVSGGEVFATWGGWDAASSDLDAWLGEYRYR
ncbi:MAG: hypothetical protein JWP08_4423 [Bryobacterales bacterium]|nr:hypothetical protein [Bryobacterales bacterium]